MINPDTHCLICRVQAAFPQIVKTPFICVQCEDLPEGRAIIELRTALESTRNELETARRALDGRLVVCDGLSAVVYACEEYIAAEDEIPERFDREDYTLSGAVKSIVFALNEAEQELTQCRQERAWQPIETAPKNGTEIIGYREDCGLMLIRWVAPYQFLTEQECEKQSEPETPDWFYADFVAGGRMSNDGNPTHWMPLPKPPSQSLTPSAHDPNAKEEA